jgi:AhpD family alkylhydroperoxidase
MKSMPCCLYGCGGIGVCAYTADPVGFELRYLAASEINGCGKCIDAYENLLRHKEIREETMIDSARIRSIVHDIGTVLDVEYSSIEEPVLQA